jgi:hypothetical protein
MKPEPYLFTTRNLITKGLSLKTKELDRLDQIIEKLNENLPKQEETNLLLQRTDKKSVYGILFFSQDYGDRVFSAKGPTPISTVKKLEKKCRDFTKLQHKNKLNSFVDLKQEQGADRSLVQPDILGKYLCSSRGDAYV